MTIYELEKKTKIYRRTFFILLLIILIFSSLIAVIKEHPIVPEILGGYFECFIGGFIIYFIAYFIIKNIMRNKIEILPGLNEDGINKTNQVLKIYSSYIAGSIMLAIGIISYLSNNFKS